jgi:hypothetical protein
LARGETTLICTDSDLQTCRIPVEAQTILERLRSAAETGADRPGAQPPVSR